MAYTFTVSPKIADPVPGPRPAPELARDDRIATIEASQATPAAHATTGRRARDPGQRAGARRPAALRDPGTAAGPGRRRSPRRPEHDLDHRDQPSPQPALPRPAHGCAHTRIPARAQPPGGLAVANAARGRARGTGCRPGPSGRDRGAGPRRRPGHPQRHRRPPPPPSAITPAAPGRPLVRPAPRNHRPRAARRTAGLVMEFAAQRREFARQFAKRNGLMPSAGNSITQAWTRHSPCGPARPGRRSCNPPGLQSAHHRGYWNEPPLTT
jgi:hypothetical protein